MFTTLRALYYYCFHSCAHYLIILDCHTFSQLGLLLPTSFLGKKSGALDLVVSMFDFDSSLQSKSPDLGKL